MFLYTLYVVTGEPIGQTPLMGQAIRAARCYAVAHGQGVRPSLLPDDLRGAVGVLAV